MEVVMLTQDINSLFASLGCPLGDDYIIGDDCQATLVEILKRLNKEDKYVRGFRRLISNSQVLKKDLLPLFYNVKNDFKILDLIIEILENLMIPVECLLPIDLMIKEDAGRSTICQLNWLLTACKEAFLNPISTKCVIDYIKLIMKKDQQLLPEGCHSVNLCLRMLRNLLHIPEVRGGAPGGGASHQNQIVWNLFTQHIDKILLQLMNECGRGRGLCCMTLVQLVSLLFKDQHSNTIYKLLSYWCDTAMSESSEDDESNTSPQDQRSGDSSSSVATSDPTSDSSDSDNQKHKEICDSELEHQYHQKQSELFSQTNRMTEIFANGVGRKAQVAMRNKHGSSKNCHPAKHRHLDNGQWMHEQMTGKKMARMWSSESGIGTGGSETGGSIVHMECFSPELSEYSLDMQHQETNSSSSNEDKEMFRFLKKNTVLQKPLQMIQKGCYSGKSPMSSEARKELCRKKLFKRSRTNVMSIKTFLNHTPTEEDIAHLLKEFTVDFLLKGYKQLVLELKLIVLANHDVHMDTSHFTWLIMFFLRFATQLELDLELISPVLSYDIISYLTYEGVNLCEELEVAKLEVGENLTRTLQKLYLVVSSLKEILFTIEVYKKVNHLSRADSKYIKQLQEKITNMNDLKNLFMLLLLHFDPSVQSHQFLQDVVVANHYLLVLMENSSQASKARLTEHIKQFATEDVMKQYGVLLSCYENNGELVNDCIFTMMHHVAGDLDKVSVLFQPPILRSFTRILETHFQIRDDWSDLVEYVVQKCLKTKQATKSHQHFEEGASKSPDDSSTLQISQIMPQSEVETPQISEWSQEDLDNLYWYFPQSMEASDPVGFIDQLFLENTGQNKPRNEIIENLLKLGLIIEDQYKRLAEREPTSAIPENIQSNNCEMDILEGVKVITEYLNGENCGFFIKWLQSSLLEACYARLVVDSQHQLNFDPVEPVAYFYTLLAQPVPLVTWSHELWRAMQLEPSVWLLSALNFLLPTHVGPAKIFARIPSEWTADHLYVAALLLGPLDSSSMKFDPSNLRVIQESSQLPTSSGTSSSGPTFHLQADSTLFGFFLGSSSAADWLQKVKQLKVLSKVQPSGDKHDWMSIISGDERDWDLTSMCVSDEGGRHDDAVLEL